MAGAPEIIALAETAAVLGSKIYKFFNSLKDAPHEVRELCDELVALRSLLSEIGMAFSNIQDALRDDGKALSTESVLVAVKRCEAEFRVLWMAVSPLETEPGIDWKRAMKKLTGSVKYVLEVDSVEKTVQKLGKEKQTPALAMHLVGM